MSDEKKSDKAGTTAAAPAPVSTKEIWWSKAKSLYQVVTVEGQAVPVKFVDHKKVLDVSDPKQKAVSDALKASTSVGLHFYQVKNSVDVTDNEAYADTLRQLFNMPEPELKRLFDPKEFAGLGLPPDGGDKFSLIAAYARRHVLTTR